MIKIFNADCMNPKDIFTREIQNNDSIEQIVADILEDVRLNGDKALYKYSKEFDNAKLDALEVSQEEIDKAYAETDRKFIKTLEMSRNNIEEFHRHQVRNDFVFNQRTGVMLGQKITPIEKAGLYVPGGTARYPSSVLMNAIPAKIAGVKDIIMVSPPGPDGRLPSDILAAAKVAGVDRIFKLGGAQAIAALTYGTESVPKVDKIVGPGNIFVSVAKRRVYGIVDIDMIAGPSEILVIADGSCCPDYVAADLLSQAEHDKLSSAVLVTNSEELAKQVQEQLEIQIPMLKREEIARESIDNNGKIIITKTIDEAVSISNMIAPEHLEICLDDPFSVLGAIKNAGSIFLGKNVPEALGDYFAGPNHTLPTSGTARFSSPLSVDDFIKKSSFIYYTEDALSEIQEHVVDFAQREGLGAHAKSIAIRFEEDKQK